MKILIVILSLLMSTLSFAQLETSAYLKSAREYLTSFSTFQKQEAEILGLQIDFEKTKSLGLDPTKYQLQMEKTKAPLVYSVFDNVAGLYNLWHGNFLSGPTSAPANYELSAQMIDSCYFRYVLHLIGVWETLSGQTYGGTPPSLETKKNHALNLEYALAYKASAQMAIEHPDEVSKDRPASADFMLGLNWMDNLPDSIFTIAPGDLGTDHIYYFVKKNDSKMFGNVEVDEIYYVEVGASGLSGIEAKGHSAEQRDALVSLLNSKYGPSRPGSPDHGGGADIHLTWSLPDKGASAEVMWWENGSINGTKLGFRLLPLH